jgi:hypothetical protein
LISQIISAVSTGVVAILLPKLPIDFLLNKEDIRRKLKSNYWNITFLSFTAESE